MSRPDRDRLDNADSSALGDAADWRTSFAFAQPFVDQATVDGRAAELGRRSIKSAAKVTGLRLAIGMVDLTTLEGQDTPQRVRQLCRKARSPAEGLHAPACAAVCVYPSFVRVAKEELGDSGVKVASVATAFPSGQSFLELKLEEVRRARECGADEIDMVIDRGALLAGKDGAVFEEIVAVKRACEGAHLKVILETGELGSYTMVRRASRIAMLAGADFIKTSTGKIALGSTPSVAIVMLEAVRDHQRETGRAVGVKCAGGIRTAKEALHYLVLVKETLGDGWLTSERFRFGASTLLHDLLMQLEKQRTGAYPSRDQFSKD